MPEFETEDVSKERVALGNGVEVPTSWSVVVSDEPGVPGTIRIEVVHDTRLNRAVAAEVRVLRQGGGDEVTSLTLREVRVQHALQVSGLLVSTVSEPGHAVVSGAGYIQRMQNREGRDLAASVIDATRTYVLAAAINLPPLKAVADGLGVSQSTATRLMNRARVEGLAPGVSLPDLGATGPIAGPAAPNGPGLGR
ncbi:hypothetical protein [Microbacterium sp.]|uniref:hypothetical protein n=1 Tax=Microbacterium sp. TaxID=51671 RepID=UPI0035B1B25E